MFHNFLKKHYETVLQIILILITFLVFSCSIHYQFLEGWDDQAYVTKNQFISLSLSNIFYWFSHAPIIGGYTPLTMISFMLDHFFWNLNSIGYHLQNIFWHAIVILTIFRIFRFFKIQPVFSFFLCLIFAVHPQRIESVVWISERKDVLCGAFYFLSILLYIKTFNEKKVTIYVFILFIFALLSKPMAFSLPFILMLYDWHKTQSISFKYYLLKFWKMLILLLPYGIITILTQSYGFIPDKLPFIKRAYIVLFNYLWYLKTTLIPINLAPIYSRVSINESLYWVISGYIFCILLLAFLFVKYKKATLQNTVPIILSYIISLAPVSGIFLIGMFDHSDRFSYIPSVFILLGIGLIINSFLLKLNKKNCSRIKLFLIIVLALYSGLMIYLNSVYIISFKSLYEMNKSCCRPSIRIPNIFALQRLGANEIVNKNYTAALDIANRLVSLIKSDSLTQSEKDSSVLSAGFLRCLSYYYLGEKEKSINLFEKIESFFPAKDSTDKANLTQLLSVAADIYYTSGKINEAVSTCNKIISLYKEGSFNYNYYCGLKLLYLKEYRQAAIYFETALKIMPDNKKAENFLLICKENI